MITIFTCPKPFSGHINIIQRNAIQSWVYLDKSVDEIILLGDDEGVKEIAKEFSLRHIGNIKKTEFGTPLLNYIFDEVKKTAKNNILIYVNADIILTSDIISAVKKINEPLFLVIGRRRDLNVKEEIDFKDKNWELKLKERAKKEGKLHGFSGIDYFIFPKELPHNMPSFAVGRVGWDGWLVYKIKSLKIPIIDATNLITAIHQNHDYSHSRWGKKYRVEGPEMKKNLKLTNGFLNILSIREADFVLTEEGLRRPKFPGNILSQLALFYPWRFLISIKRKLQNF